MRPKLIDFRNIPSALKHLQSNIPLLNLPDAPLTAPIQSHLQIADITDDLVLFKDGGAAIVMESTSLNFGLLSEKEQVAVIVSYAALINSLSFPLQIVVRSERKNISSYIKYLDSHAKLISNPKLANLMTAYRTFILETVKKKNVLGKRFFLVIPFSALELGVTKSMLSLAKRKGPLPYPKSYVIKKAKVSLYPKRDHLVRQARRLGLKLTQQSTDDLIKLYFHFYNPEKPIAKKEEN